MIPNAVVNGTHLNQTVPFYTLREMMVNPGDINDHMSDLDVPIVVWNAYDFPESVWARGDTLEEVIIEDVPGQPTYNPWHVVRVYPRPSPIPGKVLSLARVDVLQTQVLWLERITFRTPDPDASGTYATFASGYDQARSDEAVDSDESFGTGYNVSEHHGYFPAKPICLGILERRNVVDLQRSGILTYEEAEIVYEAPVALSNEDVLILPDGRRGTVSRQVTQIQMNGVTLGILSGLSIHNSDSSVIYRIPVGGG